MSSGTSRISFRTVPAFCSRSASFSSFSFAREFADHDNGINASAPAKNIVNRFLFIRIASFNSTVDQDMDGPHSRRAAVRRKNHDADQRQHSKDRRYRNGVVFFLGGLNWAYVQNLFVRRIGDALIGQGKNSDDD